MNLKKLDARFKGYNTFKHVADYNLRQDRPLYLEHRLWMWENFGPSSEFVLHHHLDPSPQWCWDVSEYNIRIYFATDKEANWFKLRWGENV